MGQERRYHWVDPQELAEPDGWAVETLRDCWWVVDDQGRLCFALLDEKRPLAYPQANAHKIIADRSASSIPGSAEVVQVPIVFRPHRCEDYD